MMKNGKRKLCIFFVVLVLCCFFQPYRIVAADNSLSEAVNGIVKIRISYQDENERTYFAREGTGFLIGESESGQYVITCKTLVDVDDKQVGKLRKENDVKKEERLTKKIEIAATSDIMIDASVSIDSADLNCAILSLASPLYNREGLRLGNTDTLQDGQDIYALEVKENSEEVGTSAGTILKKNQMINNIYYIKHTAKIESEYYGSPLLNKKGDIIGINVGNSEDNSYWAVSVSSIREILDAVGITYANTDSEPSYQLLRESLEASEALLNNGYTYTKASIKQLREAISEGRAILDTADADAAKCEEAIAAISKSEQALVTMEEKVFPIQIGLGIILMLLMLLNAIMFIKWRIGNRRTKNKPEEVKEYMDFETTVILDDSAGRPHAFLLKERSGQRIPVDKIVFRIGKAKEQVDYEVLNNKSISRHHADIVCENGFFFAIDRNSLNHTMVNGEILTADKKKAIRNRDKIKFADEEFIFEIKE